MIVYVLTLWFDEAIFVHPAFPTWVEWIYLPTGIRLLSTLLLGADGAIGLLGALILLYIFNGMRAFLPTQRGRSRMRDGMFRARLALDNAYNNRLA